MRIIAILGSLIVGLVGLFMSVCGGGFLISFGYAALRNIMDHTPNAFYGLSNLLLPAGFLAVGIVVCRFAYQSVRRDLNDK